MALILRGGLNRPLTIDEMDGNFTYLEGLSGGGGSGATPSLQDVTNISSITTNDIIIGSVSGLYSILEDTGILINYYDGITVSNTNRGYLSAFNEWGGSNTFEAYYETYNGASYSYYDIYANNGQITLYTKSEGDVERGLRINETGFILQNGGNNVTLAVNNLSADYTLNLPTKSNGTYTLATTDDLLTINGVISYYNNNSFSSYNQITILGSTTSTNIVLRNEDSFFRINAFGNNSNSAFAIADFGLFAFVSGDNLKYASFDFSGNTDTLNTNYSLVNKSGMLPVFNTTAVSASNATGKTGEIRVNSGFIYVCVATNTWLRASIASW